MTISTHILDTAKGNPADGVSITLQKQTGKSWAEVGKGATNADGRCSFEAPGEGGNYQLLFHVESYLKKNASAAFYTEIPVVFKIEDTGRKYHIPLLLSPFGYSTYRGS